MIRLPKTQPLAILLAAVAVATPLTALAQTSSTTSGPTAAATLPNTFDRPQAAPARPQTDRSTPEAKVAAPEDPARAAAAETMLRTTIAAMQAGSPNYGDMSDDLASKVREQSSAITPLIQSFGPLKDLAHVGVENGAELFLVHFDHQATQWIIAQNPQGKIVALLFRPAPPAG